MNIDDLTLGQIKELQNLLGGAISSKKHRYIGKYVVIRTYSAGVHIGILDEYDANTKSCFLTETRRLYRWDKAFTLSTVADKGIAGDSKLPAEQKEIYLERVIEIILCSKESEKIIREWAVHG